MPEQRPLSLFKRIKELVIGGARSPHEAGVFHKLSLVAFFAWIGLGADGLSSSCYGPSEAFAALHEYTYLSVFIAAATALTIFVIASSYQQIIELFPAGGGGYLVASKLLTPKLGMISGCALMVDYVLTIAVSVASGTDALFSMPFFPHEFLQYKLAFSVAAIGILTLLNLRGVRESIGPLVPIFLVFVFAHAFVIVYTFIYHGQELPGMWEKTASATSAAQQNLGTWGMLFLIMHAYSMGAGTYTGIEAVSNGMPILREPRVRTAKRTMTYMWVSLAVTVTGLTLGYLLFNVRPEEGKTLNATLLESVTRGWPAGGHLFVVVTLISEAALLYVAAQTGFLGGPRVLANMAQDRWFPTRLSMLSDRLVTQNGILLMSGAALVTILLTSGMVTVLVVLYSINVFITFALSQAGMVRHWWQVRRHEPKWNRKLFVSGIGLVLTLFILTWTIIAKFFEGGWTTLVVTGALAAIALLIKRHYNASRRYVEQFDSLAMAALKVSDLAAAKATAPDLKPDPTGRTAVILVSGFNGMGVHLLMNVFRFFGETFKNFVFLQVGMIDTGNFKGADEVKHLQEHIDRTTGQYVDMMRKQGFYAEPAVSVGTDIVEQVETLGQQIVQKYPQAIFFAGQLLFPNDSTLTRLLHNNITFALQRRLYHEGIPFMMLPIRVAAEPAKAPG